MAGSVLSSRNSAASSSGIDSQFATVRLSALRPGARLHHPILDERNVLLLAAGAQLTPSVLKILASRGLEFVKVHRSELAACTGEYRDTTAVRNSFAAARDRMVRISSSRDTAELAIARSEVDRSGEFLSKVRKQTDSSYDSSLQEKYHDTFEQSKSQVDSLFNGLDEVRRTELDMLEGITETSLTQMVDDMDLFLTLGVSPNSELYPARHSLQSAMLALSIGSHYGLDKSQLVNLGIGCLVHDIGMLEVDKQLVASKSPLDPLRFLEITKHPTATFDKMRAVQQLAGTSRLVAYQVHERLDGTGYPRQRKGFQIHELSRIASVADVFVALISPRPHRPGMMPYYAVEHLLHAANGGQFDADVVRALLHAVSLFPIGSCVELNDGCVGRVIRSNGADFMRPTLEVWNRACLAGDPEIVNLTQRPELKILRPIGSFIRQDTRQLELVDSWE
jgi:HD-GYP domain-containing protein (c-di-GMP phosphodiesterase class II)